MSADTGPVRSISPEPTDEEAAAVAAAVTAVLTAATPAAGPAHAPDPGRWRFSGRWWSRPVPARRNRP